MSSSRHQQLEQLFSDALKRRTPAERDAYLCDACGDDVGLRNSVNALLRAHRDAGGFLDTPAIDPNATRLSPTQHDPAGTHIGPYKLLQQIGEGGFGNVYMAEQEQPVRRKVALKIIKPGMDTRQVIARFEAERQALALMDHPNIARVFDAGATEFGRPYFVMELVKGIPITEYCDKAKLTVRQRLELFLSVCQAVQHAHQKGIIHRDLKPNNVLVTLHDSRPVPKVIDFGIAKATSQKLTDKTLFTEFRQFIGTPEYMSPDQAEISGLDVDTRTDIYSLGVLLYELLTGTTPFDAKTLRGAGYDEIKRIIRDVEPPMPSTRVHTLRGRGAAMAIPHHGDVAPLSRLMRGELDWIVMKAIEKDRTRRYQTANDLANDISRHLNDEPVLAGPPSVTYKLRKFVRRNRVSVAAGGVVAGAVIIGLALATVGFVEARRERDMAQAARAQEQSARERADQEAARSQAIADFLQDMLVSTDPDQAVGLGIDVEHVLATARDVFGDDHATVAATLSSRALQLQNAGNLGAAEPLYRESLRIWKRLYGEDNLNVAITLGRLGQLLHFKEDMPGAEHAYREVIRIVDALPGEPSVAVCDSMERLADLLRDRREYDEAEGLLRRSVQIRRATTPHEHFQIAATLSALTRLLIDAGRTDSARQAVQEALAEWRKALPAKGLVLARILTEVGIVHLDHESPDEAEPLLREALQICAASAEPPIRHRDLALRALYRIMDERDNSTPAFDSVRLEFIEYLRSVVGDNHLMLARALAETAAKLAEHERIVDAIPLHIEALEIHLKYGDELDPIDEAMVALRDITAAIARDPQRPANDYEAGLRAAEMFLSVRSGAYDVLTIRGMLQFRLGRFDDALETLSRCDAYFSDRPDDYSPTYLAFMAMAQCKAGNEQAAGNSLDRLRAELHSDGIPADHEAHAFLIEAEQLIEGGA